MKQNIAVVGTGWAGHILAHKLDTEKYDVTVISPESTFAYTPLLASAACGLFDFRIAEEPLRRKSKHFRYIKAVVIDIDFDKRTLTCEPAFESLRDQQFQLSYDLVILAPGCKTNTFGTPGVDEHAFFVKTVGDAVAVRHRLEEMLEMASLPNTTEARQRDLLHVAVVGGGPTGIEMAAELADLFDEHLSKTYPHLEGKFSVAVHDVASQILAPYEKKLSEYATRSLKHQKVQIKLNSNISSVTAEEIETKEEGKKGFGMLIWATGNKQVPLVEALNVDKSSKGMPRILTDRRLRIRKTDGTVFENAFALGDAADIDGATLPTTAEVATQKAKYLFKVLNSSNTDVKPFSYSQRAMTTYTGGKDGVVEGKQDYSGYAAWLSWRSSNLFWTESWRRRVQMCIGWAMDWLDGREIARN